MVVGVNTCCIKVWKMQLKDWCSGINGIFQTMKNLKDINIQENWKKVYTSQLALADKKLTQSM